MKKMILSNLATHVSADAEGGSNPASNLLTADVKELWKGTTNIGVLDVIIDPGSDCITVHNTNADSIEIELFSGDESSGELSSGISILAEVSKDLNIGDFLLGNMWYDYTSQASACRARLTLTCVVGTTIEAGILRAGAAVDGASKLGLVRGSVSHSVVRPKNDGSEYVNDGDSSASFASEIYLSRSVAKELRRCFDIKKMNPFPILVSDEDYEDWAYWAYVKKFDVTYETPTHCRCSFEIEEVGQSLRTGATDEDNVVMGGEAVTIGGEAVIW